MSDALRQAKDRVKSLRDQADELEEYIREIEGNLAKMTGISSLNAPRPKTRSSSSSSSFRVIVGAVVAILQESPDKSASSRLIFEKLKERGVTIGGQDPLRNLSSKLSHMVNDENCPVISLGRSRGYTLRPESITVSADLAIPPSATGPKGA